MMSGYRGGDGRREEKVLSCTLLPFSRLTNNGSVTLGGGAETAWICKWNMIEIGHLKFKDHCGAC